MKPICYDLYCGLGGWAEGFLSEGFRCIGYDIEKHDYGTGTYPGELILADVRSIHGSQLADAACIVASPPCQEPAFRAQPWKSAKAVTPEVLPDWWHKVERNPANLKNKKVEVMSVKEMEEWVRYKTEFPLPSPTLFIELFNACFRIQREASEVAGRYIPMVVENVVGAQRWVGRARWHFGSYYLWGDVPALMPITLRMPMKLGVTHRSNGETNFHGVKAGDRCRDKETGNWTTGWNVKNAQVFRAKQESKKCGGAWFGKGNDCSLMRQHSSKSDSRKAASAEIAKIPFPLAQHIARCFKPKAALCKA